MGVKSQNAIGKAITVNIFEAVFDRTRRRIDRFFLSCKAQTPIDRFHIQTRHVEIGATIKDNFHFMLLADAYRFSFNTHCVKAYLLEHGFPFFISLSAFFGRKFAEVLSGFFTRKRFCMSHCGFIITLKFFCELLLSTYDAGQKTTVKVRQFTDRGVDKETLIQIVVQIMGFKMEVILSRLFNAHPLIAFRDNARHWEPGNINAGILIARAAPHCVVKRIFG